MKGKGSNYYLVEDLLSCLPDNVERNLLSTLHGHQVSKEAISEIFQDEIKKPKLNYRIIYGVLLVYADYLRYHQRLAYYEVLPV